MKKNRQRLLRQEVKTIPLSRRRSKVSISMFGRPSRRGASFGSFLRSFPRVLAAEDFRGCVSAIVRARRMGKPVIAGMGGHVVKCGLSRFFIDMLRRRIVTALAMNGAAGIHDFEIALAGKTSEDVQEGLGKGMFGMAEETGVMMNEALAMGAAEGLGAGWAIGKYILQNRFPHRDASMLATAVSMRLPATVHMAIGTDTIHQHPSADGRVLGETTMSDFRIFTELVGGLGGGGVMLNFGSAVVMPEVFLKALSVSRNRRRDVTDFTTANFDMLLHYRPMQNLVRRPVAAGGKGYYLIGHHEIMVPLLSRAIIEAI